MQDPLSGRTEKTYSCLLEVGKIELSISRIYADAPRDNYAPERRRGQEVDDDDWVKCRRD